MQFVHRVSIASSPAVQSELADMGFAVDAKGLVSFEIEESDESWPKMRQWIAARTPVDIVTTRFTDQEIAAAAWLELIPDGHHGYPQPDENGFGYRVATYDMADYCSECGIGLTQRAPFQMKAEPKWGKKEILQLNWVFDEYFVTPGLWRRVFEPLRIACREVQGVNNQVLNSVVQLVVGESIDILSDGLTAKNCTKCGCDKFIPVARGAFPALAREATGHMAKTVQYFGSGGSASKRVVISHELGNALDGVRGISVRPVAKSARP